ncbi:AAA family ATPase [Candidatus Micrarchaeota archaeon]|nr:AAA family ATPase [Candidatus Micrarchaeota archaeon]
MALRQTSLAQQKVAAYVMLAEKSEGLWNGLIVFLGALFLLGAFPFYPLPIVFGLALLCGIVASRNPPIAIILGALLAFPAILYQSPFFGWVYLVMFSILLFEVFENWMIIATLEMLVLAPFAFRSFSLSGWITILGMTAGALYFGSRKNIAIALPAVVLILLLSSIWGVQNTAYMPLNLKLYQPGMDELKITKTVVGIEEVIPKTIGSFAEFLSFKSLGSIFNAIGAIGDNLISLAINDTLIAQLIIWAATLYLIASLSIGKGRFNQLKSSLPLLLLGAVYYGIYLFYKIPFKIEFAGGIIFTIVFLGILEQVGITISRESEIERKEKMKSYGKFGMSDISLSGSEKSMKDVGGYEDVKEELRSAIMLPLDKKEIAYTYGIKPPSGILLFGPPGTGKTMLMRALAKELRYNFVEVRCSQILSQWYGESEKNVAEVFVNARKNAPTILFFDEIDSIAKQRNSDSIDEVGPRVLTTLLQEMDGASKSKATVMVVGATNMPQELDHAIMRPGRFDKIIYMHLPDFDARKAIFAVDMKGLPLEENIDLDKLARKTERFSGADIKNIVEETKRFAAKEAAAKGVVIPLTMEHFLEVIAQIKPSTALAQLEQYEQFKMDFERSVGTQQQKKEDEGERIKWEDVAGLGQVKKTLLEAIQLPLLYEKEMKDLKVKPYKGLLLFGPPGTGKTLIVKAACNELKASFQTLSGAELMKKGYTQAVTIIKETFNRARENAPAILFVDEIETFAPARGGASSEILGQFLTELDGVKELKGVVIIAATNKPSLLDPAILRPGRFDKIFYIPPPSAADRAEIFRIHLGQFAKAVDLGILAEAAEGFSGADIAAIAQDLKMEALRGKISGKEFKATTERLLKMIKKRRPSITSGLLAEYRSFIDSYGERGGDDGEEESEEPSKGKKAPPDTHYR